MTNEEQALARKLKGPSQMDRVRAARAIIESHRGYSDGLALEGFMAIFHPEYTTVQVKALRRACNLQER